MLIEIPNLKISKPVHGIIHIGAHECEERQSYHKFFNLDDSKIIWIDALTEKVNLVKKMYPNVIIYNECISNTDNQKVSFMITNNYQSSSILNFKLHSTEHPHVKETKRIDMTTKTLNTIFKENNLKPNNYNFINIDIQGAELLALQGSLDILPSIDYIYLEINEKELYEGCALLPEIDTFLFSHGFSRVQTSMTRHGWGDAFYSKFI